VVNIADWKATGLTPEQFFEKAVQTSPYVASRLKPGVRQESLLYGEQLQLLVQALRRRRVLLAATPPSSWIRSSPPG